MPSTAPRAPSRILSAVLLLASLVSFRTSVMMKSLLRDLSVLGPEPFGRGRGIASGSESSGTHELLHLGLGLRLVETIALLHLGRKPIDVLGCGCLIRGDLGPSRRNVLSRNVI